MSSLDDPRVFFAAERTLLAWVRSGLGSMGLGVVVAKSGVVIRLMAVDGQGVAPVVHERLALAVGVLLVGLGMAACALAALQFRRFVTALAGAEVPARWLLFLPGLFAWTAAAAGALVIVALVL